MRVRVFLVFFLTGVWTTLVDAADASAWAVPTFESLGLYSNCDMAKDSCRVQYRTAGRSDWRGEDIRL